MPLYVFRKLGLREVKPTIVHFQLEHRSITYQSSLIEDVLIKINKYIFLMDFIVLQMEENEYISLILGRPFLAIGRTLIDVQQGKLNLRVEDEQVNFEIFKVMTFPFEMNSCFGVDALDIVVAETFKDSLYKSPLELCLTQSKFLYFGRG